MFCLKKGVQGSMIFVILSDLFKAYLLGLLTYWNVNNISINVLKKIAFKYAENGLTVVFVYQYYQKIGWSLLYNLGENVSIRLYLQKIYLKDF